MLHANRAITVNTMIQLIKSALAVQIIVRDVSIVMMTVLNVHNV